MFFYSLISLDFILTDDTKTGLQNGYEHKTVKASKIWFYSKKKYLKLQHLNMKDNFSDYATPPLYFQ